MDRDSQYRMTPESERMKIELASNYVTSSYLNMAIFLVTSLIVVFAVLLAALLAHQIELVQIPFVGVPIEAIVLYALYGQNQKFERRLEYLDTLINNTESNPPVPLGSVKDIIKELRKK